MRRTTLAVAFAGILTAGSAAIFMPLSRGDDGPAVPQFVDEARTAGISHVYDGEFPFFVGGGVATFDCSGDGMPDLYMAGGTNPASLFVNTGEPGSALRFE